MRDDSSALCGQNSFGPKRNLAFALRGILYTLESSACLAGSLRAHETSYANNVIYGGGFGPPLLTQPLEGLEAKGMQVVNHVCMTKSQ